jgi:hypothetical protein
VDWDPVSSFDSNKVIDEPVPAISLLSHGDCHYMEHSHNKHFKAAVFSPNNSVVVQSRAVAGEEPHVNFYIMS